VIPVNDLPKYAGIQSANFCKSTIWVYGYDYDKEDLRKIAHKKEANKKHLPQSAISA
jgi:hypothetical protein